MIQTFARPNRLWSAVLLTISFAIVAIVASSAITLLAGTKTGLVLAVLAIGGPLLAYVAIATPIVFPFGLYVMLVPFNNLLDFSSFGTATKFLAMLAGGALVFYLARTRRIVRPPAALLWWCGLAVWMTATAFWAIDQHSVFALLPTALQLIVLYAVISMIPVDARSLRWVLIATIAGGFLAAAYGSYLFHSGANIYYGGRLRITTDTSAIDPNHFAAALLLPIALCTAQLMYARKFLPAALYAFAILMMLVGVAESASRGGMLGIAAIMGYLFLRSNRRWRLAIAVPVAAAATMVNPTMLWDRVGQAFTSGGSGRVPIWHVGVTALKSHWLLGAGYNNFTFAYDQAFLQTAQTQFADWHRAPHNLLLGTSVELGILGLVLLLAAWVAQFRMLRHVPATDTDFPIRLALEGALIGSFIAAMFLDVMIMKYLWLTFMLAAIVRNAHLTRETAVNA
jgi:O-antigen ligase